MGYKCCVLECKSNYQYLRNDKRETKSESLRREWIKNTKPGSENYPKYQSLYQPFPQR